MSPAELAVQVGSVIEELMALVEQAPNVSTGDVSDVDMAVLYLRHAKRHLESE